MISLACMTNMQMSVVNGYSAIVFLVCIIIIQETYNKPMHNYHMNDETYIVEKATKFIMA